jgi:hypothetical protein
MIISLEKYKIHQDEGRRDQEAFCTAVLGDKNDVSKKGPYTLGFWGRFRALTIRRFQSRIQDRF